MHTASTLTVWRWWTSRPSYLVAEIRSIIELKDASTNHTSAQKEVADDAVAKESLENIVSDKKN